MENNTLLAFFEVLSSKIICCFSPKNTISTLRSLKFKGRTSIDSRDVLGKITRISLLSIVCFFGFSTIVAQTTPTFPPQERCTSKDLELVSATLTNGGACTSCELGDSLTKTLTLGINNKTGSNRTAFAFWGTLEITHADGSIETTEISRCSDANPIPPTGPLPAVYTGGNFGTITYLCGDSLRLINLYLAWTDASPKSTCATINSAKINPKCGTLPSIQINTGVNGTLAVTDATCSELGSIDLTPFGGIPFAAPAAPYTYSWSASDGGAIPAGQSDDQDLTGLVSGTYSVLITDSAGCTTTKEGDVGTPDGIDPPTFCLVQPSSLCDATSATGSVIINTPCGEGYEYSIDDGTTWQSGTVFSGLAAGAVTGIKVKLGDCTSDKASCDDSDCDATPCPVIDENKTAKAVAPTEATTEKVVFEAYPVPFKDQLTIRYNFDYASKVKIEVFDGQGNLVLSKTDANSYLNKEIALDLKLNRGRDQVYVVKLTTDRESSTKKVISSR
ncbi:T9SS type A sorting domain-containing protein [Flavobacterium sp. ZB4P13]|uniref:T9SS type A sorting domain-containing protein n=1 Tax=Flavobacterium sp. ZB4P13 TaxID=3401728 RepID=UPI003AAB8F36